MATLVPKSLLLPEQNLANGQLPSIALFGGIDQGQNSIIAGTCHIGVQQRRSDWPTPQASARHDIRGSAGIGGLGWVWDGFPDLAGIDGTAYCYLPLLLKPWVGTLYLTAHCARIHADADAQLRFSLYDPATWVKYDPSNKLSVSDVVYPVGDTVETPSGDPTVNPIRFADAKAAERSNPTEIIPPLLIAPTNAYRPVILEMRCHFTPQLIEEDWDGHVNVMVWGLGIRTEPSSLNLEAP